MRLTALAALAALAAPTNDIASDLCTAVDNIAGNLQVVLEPVANLTVCARGDKGLLDGTSNILPDITTTPLANTLAAAKTSTSGNLSMAERMD